MHLENMHHAQIVDTIGDVDLQAMTQTLLYMLLHGFKKPAAMLPAPPRSKL